MLACGTGAHTPPREAPPAPRLEPPAACAAAAAAGAGLELEEGELAPEPLAPPVPRAPEPLGALQRRLLAKAAARAAAVAAAAEARASGGLREPSAAPRADRPGSAPPGEPPPASRAALATLALPPGVALPAFALQPPAAVSRKNCRAVFAAMVLQLTACGWVGPGRLDERAIKRLWQWQPLSDAVVGLHFFFEELARLPALLHTPARWSGVAILSARAARVHAEAVGRAQLVRALNAAEAAEGCARGRSSSRNSHRRGRSRSRSRGGSEGSPPAQLRAPADALWPVTTGDVLHNLLFPAGVIIPRFARAPVPDAAPGVGDAVLIRQMTKEVMHTGWVRPGGLDMATMYKLRHWNPPYDAVVGLRMFFEDVLVNKPALQLRAQDWNKALMRRVVLASNVHRRARRGAASPRAGTRRSRSRSREGHGEKRGRNSRSRERSPPVADEPLPAPGAPSPPAPPAPAAAAAAPKAPRYVCRDPATGQLHAYKLSVYRAWVASGKISAATAAQTRVWPAGADEADGVPMAEVLAQNNQKTTM